jgi:hypothetical protein
LLYIRITDEENAVKVKPFAVAPIPLVLLSNIQTSDGIDVALTQHSSVKSPVPSALFIFDGTYK